MSTIPEMVKELTDDYDFDSWTLARLVVEQGGTVLEGASVVSESRWSLRKRIVVRDPESGDLYGVEWNEGATEMQEDIEPEAEVYKVVARPTVSYVKE